jgi:CheY-like chemotaxis protein
VVIEDDPAVLDVICDVLQLEGYTVVGLKQSPLAETLRATTASAVFLIDIMLGEANGIEVAESLRRGGFPDSPMVAMSASKHMVAEAQGTGLFQETLGKPFDLDTLVDAVGRAIAPGRSCA